MITIMYFVFIRAQRTKILPFGEMVVWICGWHFHGKFREAFVAGFDPLCPNLLQNETC
jgi:hypothetical protein